MTAHWPKRLGVWFAVLVGLIALPASVWAGTITFTGVPPGNYTSYTEAGMVFTDFNAPNETFQILAFSASEQQIRKVGGFTGGVFFRMVDGSPFTLRSLIGGGGGNFNVLFAGFDVNGNEHDIASTGGLINFPQPDWSQIVRVNMDVTRFIVGGAGTIAHVVFDPVSVSAVPEPASILLLGSGVAGLIAWGAASRRHRER